MVTNTISPLSGMHILITRPEKAAHKTAERLAVLGAIPYIYPTIFIDPPEDGTQIKTILSCSYLESWVLCHSRV